MAWDKAYRWDGESHKEEIAAALTEWLTDEDRRTAARISYGDLGQLLSKEYRNRGCIRNDCILWGYREGAEVSIHKFRCQITWNKAAKLIKETIMMMEDQ